MDTKLIPVRMLNVPPSKVRLPVPKLAARDTASVPEPRSVPPLKVFSPLRVNCPAPDFARLVPRRTPSITKSNPVSTLSVPPDAPSPISRRLLNVKLPTLRSTPPFKTRWLAVLTAGAVPRFASADIVSVPPFIVVEPLKVLAPLSVKVPDDKVNDPPTPEITPAITPVELVIVKFFAPNNKELSAAAVIVRTAALPVTPLISKPALLVTPLEL